MAESFRYLAAALSTSTSAPFCLSIRVIKYIRDPDITELESALLDQVQGAYIGFLVF